MKLGIVIFSLAIYQIPYARSAEPNCPPFPVGVHEIEEQGTKFYISVARAESLSESEESFVMAEAEARVNARASLMKYLSPEAKFIRFSGLIDTQLCRETVEVFAAIKLNEQNRKRAVGLGKMISDSINKHPSLLK